MIRKLTAEKIENQLADIVKGDVFTDILHRAAYSTDASMYCITPKCVVAPYDTEDIRNVVAYAIKTATPIAPRGAGSGLAGEALTEGIVIDTSRYMNKILSTDDNGLTVTCEPGVVLDMLNNYLSQYGRKIGPDPSSGNRATIGGCVANNATGAHSLQYGYIAEYVEQIEAVLADGSLAIFGNDINLADITNEKVKSIAEKCISLLADKQAFIEQSLPSTKRNRSGYNISNICHDGKVDLAKLLAGSEGTLAIFTKIKLRTVTLPGAKGLLQLEFDSLDKMAKAVPIIVDSGASACELMDKNLTAMALQAMPEYKDILSPDAQAVLLVEHVGKDHDEVKTKISKTDDLVDTLAYRRRIFTDQKSQNHAWKSRKDAVPLLYRKKRDKLPVAFIEDVSVDNKLLGQYLKGLETIKNKYDLQLYYYGHAGDGELHIRPDMDLSKPTEIEKMQQIANDVFTLAWQLGGTISGEHAEGLARSGFIKQQYGQEYYNLLCEIKNIFDPDSILNPGKIISQSSGVVTENLRAENIIQKGKIKSDLIFTDEEFAGELNQCNGCGLCLSKSSDIRMCPVFRGLGDELASSRAKANIIRFWATGQLSDKDFESAEFKKILDLCVNCKACSMQCPSGVDVSKLITAAKSEYVRRKGLKRAEFVLSNNRYLSIIGSAFSFISNFVTGLPVFSFLLEKTAGLDRHRKLPSFESRSFIHAARKLLKSSPKIKNPIDKVVYFVDSFANYNDHELGFSVLEVLRHNNIEVVLPDQVPAPLPAFVYGDIKKAKKDLVFNVKNMAEYVNQGCKIICSEPSAALFLKSEIRLLDDNDDARKISANTFELMNYLLGLYRENKLKSTNSPIEGKFVYHCPCHLLALGNDKVSIELLKALAGIDVKDLNSGCCGLAGTFGMQKKNYEISTSISDALKNALDSNESDYVLTECAACGMQIKHISKKHVIHPIKILARAYGLF